MKKSNIEKKAMLIGMYAMAASSLVGCGNKQTSKEPYVITRESGEKLITSELSTIDIETPYARSFKIIALVGEDIDENKKMYETVKDRVPIEIYYNKFGKIVEAQYPSQNLASMNEFRTMVKCNIYSFEPLTNLADDIEYFELCNMEDKFNEIEEQTKERK